MPEDINLLMKECIDQCHKTGLVMKSGTTHIYASRDSLWCDDGIISHLLSIKLLSVGSDPLEIERKRERERIVASKTQTQTQHTNTCR